jgi:hypothetical protein
MLILPKLYHNRGLTYYKLGNREKRSLIYEAAVRLALSQGKQGTAAEVLSQQWH